jgi:hypothetical protein
MASTMGESVAAATGTATMSTGDAKILSDLGTLKEKMELCDSMLNPGAGDPKLSVKNSEAMLAVIGYLEACGPRMVELVEAAAAGALSEEVFAECLSVNDRLQKQLADVETAALTETGASTTAASVAAPSGSVQEQFEDLLLDDSSGAQPAPAGPKSTGEEQDDSKQPALAKAGSNDEFDTFFTDRTTGQS